MPTSVLLGGTSTLTADITKNTNNANTNGGTAPIVMVGRNFVFDAGTKGTINAPLIVAIPAGGTTTKTFTANGTSADCGAATPSVTVESLPQPVTITIQCPDLTIAKTNNVANNSVVGQQWTWTLTASNASGGASTSATFAAGQTVLTDNLPNGANISYGAPTTAANMTCAINGTKDLTCTANAGGVTIAAGGSITVTFTATGTSPAAQANPRGGGISRIDSGSLIVESNEGNNDASANTVTVNKANTSMSSITDSPDPSVVGQAYTVGLTLNVTAPGSGTPTGTVSVNDGTGGMCTATLPTMNCMLTSTTQGVKTVTLTYNGDSNFNTSSNTAGHLVNKANTSVGIVSSQNPSLTGQSVTFTATANVTAPGAGTPTGKCYIPRQRYCDNGLHECCFDGRDGAMHAVADACARQSSDYGAV